MNPWIAIIMCLYGRWSLAYVYLLGLMVYLATANNDTLIAAWMYKSPGYSIRSLTSTRHLQVEKVPNGQTLWTPTMAIQVFSELPRPVHQLQPLGGTCMPRSRRFWDVPEQHQSLTRQPAFSPHLGKQRSDKDAMFSLSLISLDHSLPCIIFFITDSRLYACADDLCMTVQFDEICQLVLAEAGCQPRKAKISLAVNIRMAHNKLLNALAKL